VVSYITLTGVYPWNEDDAVGSILKADFEFPPEPRLSKSAKVFIKKILIPNPKKKTK